MQAPATEFDFSVTSEVPAPLVSEPAANVLLTGKTLLLFSSPPAPQTTSFMAVRMGTAQIVVTPTIGNSFSIPVEISAPAALGATNNVWNDLVVRYAHQRAIPPQWLKAQIENEAEKLANGEWDPFTYRYEPLSVDLAFTSKPGAYPPATREQIPYDRYRMAAQGNEGILPAGTHVLPADVSPRQRYYVDRGVIRHVDPADTDVTAREIYEVNDGHVSPKYKGIWKINWSQASPGLAKQVANELMNGNDLLSFNAQTTIAASYGLMQTLYSSAIRPWYWRGWNKTPLPTPLNPSFLFDTPQNIQNGDGSVAVSTKGLVYHFYQSAKQKKIANPLQVDSYDQLWDRWKDLALSEYNKDPGYRKKVENEVPKFAPVTAGAIFGN